MYEGEYFNTAAERRAFHAVAPVKKERPRDFNAKVIQQLSELQRFIKFRDHIVQVRRYKHPEPVTFDKASELTGIPTSTIGSLVRMKVVSGNNKAKIVRMSSLWAWVGLQQEKKAA